MNDLAFFERQRKHVFPPPINHGEKLRQEDREGLAWPCDGLVTLCLFPCREGSLPQAWTKTTVLLGALHLLLVCALFMSDLSPSWSLSPGVFSSPPPTHVLIAH